MTVWGLGGSNSLNVYDQNDTTAATYSVTSSSVTRSGSAAISYASLSSLELDGGSGNDTYNIESTAAATQVGVAAGNSTNTFNISPTAKDLSTIQGNLTVSSGSNNNALVLDDQANSANSTYSLVGSTVSRTGTATITYLSVDSLVLNGGSGNDIYNIQGTGGETPVSIVAGKGNDTFNVSPSSKNLGTVNAPLSINGGGGNDSMVLDDQAYPTSTTYVLTPTTVSRAGMATVTYVAVESVTLNGGSGGDTYDVSGTAAGVKLTIDAGAGNDTLIGPNAASTWNITGANAGTVGNVTFAAIENLTGGTLTDAFKFAAGGSVTGKINGGGGTNTLDYSGDGGIAATVNLASDTATKTGGFANIQSLVGSSSTADQLIGPNSNNTWTLTGANAGTVGSFSFSAIENLTGGTANDTFKFAAAGSVAGKINGGGGSNTLDYSGDGGAAATVNLAVDTATRTGGFANIQSLVGSSSSADQLIGPNTTNTWSITAVNGGMVGSFSFSGVENLTGGTANDTFKFSNGKGVAGKVNGGGGTNTLDYSLYTTGVTVNLTAGTATGTGGIANIQNVTGSPANDHITGNGANNVIIGNGGIDVLNGGGGGSDLFILVSTQAAGTTITGAGTTDTIQGANIANTWTISGSNAGSVNGIAFTGIANLTGGSSTDTFKFTSAGSITGKVDGGGGTNTLNYSGDGGIAATVNLVSDTATRTGGFANIQSLVGSSSTADQLIGPNSNNTWTLTGANAGTVGSFSFSAVENLTGGTANDTFKFAAGGSVTGKINGGGGTNTLDYSGDGGAAATVNLATSTATRTGGFASIQSLVGSSSTADKLIGPNTTNTWSITAVNGGTVGSFSFSGIENLTGGSGLDIFVFSAGKSVSGKIDGGGGGNDWLDYAAYTTPVTVNLATGTATGVGGGIANIRDVRGGQGGNTLTGDAQGNILIGGAGPNTIVGGSGRSILIGGKGKDTVTGNSGGDILIAGYTNFDSSSLANDLALESILAEWQSANSYATRISHIKNGGGLNGSNKFDWGVTVHDNSTANANKLTGGGGAGGQNWFFANLSHTTTNKTPGEQLN